MSQAGYLIQSFFHRPARHLIFLCVGVLLATSAWADATGDQLAQRMYDRPNGKDATSLLVMSLQEKGRAPRERKMLIYRLDKSGGEVVSLIRFLEPTDIEGTGLLTQDKANGDSNQWVYLPAMDRVRRIDSGRKGGRFVNSDYFFRNETCASRNEQRTDHQATCGAQHETLETSGPTPTHKARTWNETG